MLVCEMEASDIVTYQKVRLARSAAGATINKEIARLASIFSDCGVWEQVRRDVKRLDENEEGGQGLEPRRRETAPRVCFCRRAPFGNWTPLYTVTALGLNTGMRHREIRALKWKNLTTRTECSKWARARRRPVGVGLFPRRQPAWAALAMWASRFPDRQPDHFVFPAWENGRIDFERPIANWRTAWRRACRAAGLEGLRFHDLRHTAATKLSEASLRIFSDGLRARRCAWQNAMDTSGPKCNGWLLRQSQRQKFDLV
jgi:hypothetical protein